MDLTHYNERARQFQKIKDYFTEESFRAFLKEKIKSTDIGLVKNDVMPFIDSAKKLDIWDNSYFLQVVDQMKIK